MEPLIDIKINPIEIDMTYECAKLEVVDQVTPSYYMTRQVGGLDISYKPGRMLMDSYEMRSSLGMKNTFDLTKEYASKGMSNVHTYMQSCASDSRMYLSMGENGTPSNVIAQRALHNINGNDPLYNIAFVPTAPVHMQWQPHELNMNYTPDKLNFDWNVQTRAKLKYTPATLEFNVVQYPSVEVTYLAGPNYAPPSSAPDYA